jgi:hypothetical protein
MKKGMKYQAKEGYLFYSNLGEIPANSLFWGGLRDYAENYFDSVSAEVSGEGTQMEIIASQLEALGVAEL